MTIQGRAPLWRQGIIVVTAFATLFQLTYYLTHQEAIFSISSSWEEEYDQPVLVAGVEVTSAGITTSNELVKDLPKDLPKPPMKRAKKHGRNNDGIAACLLIMDDTVFLKEWLAYHYTLLPLSSLIIAPDPKNSPSSVRRIQQISKRYQALGVNVTFWYNDTYIPDSIIRQDIQKYDHYITHNNRNETGKNETGEWWKTHLDRRIKTKPQAERQCQFAAACMKAHKQNGQDWVLLTDTDEFLIYNYIQPKDENYSHYDPSRKKERVVNDERNTTKPIRDSLPPLNSTNKYTTVSEFINSFEHRPKCYRIPGLRFGGHPSSKEKVQKGLTQNTLQGVPHPERLVTVAHRSHDKLRHGRFSKVMVDVSRIEEKELTRKKCHTIHTAQFNACRSRNGAKASGTDYIAAVFRIHHHQGSLESFMERAGDYRGGRTEATYQETLEAYDPTVTDDDIRPWLNRFVANVGANTSRTLLEQQE